MSSNELHIKLDGLELSDKDLASLERDINSVVLKHIATTKQHDLIGSASGATAISSGKLNPNWRGIWLRNFKNKIELDKEKFTPAQTLGGHTI